jgi:GT2 family glycosyltransferase
VLSVVVVIPLYNGARWIERALWSAINQTRPASEVVVVDDGSTDGGAGAAIVRRVAGQGVSTPVTLLTKPNGGQSSARNYGVAHSKGDLIALLDQDDVWYPHHLACLVEPFEAAGVILDGMDRRKDCAAPGWTYGDADMIDEFGNVTRRRWHDHAPGAHPKQTLREFIECDMHIIPSASLVSRTAFERVGGFDERLIGYEDDDLFLRIFQAGFRSAYVPEPLSQWRLHAGSASHTLQMARSRVIYANKLFEMFPEFSHVITARFIRTIRGVYISALKTGDSQTLCTAVRDAGTILQRATGARAALLYILSFVARRDWLTWLAGSGVGRYVIRMVWKPIMRRPG